MRGKNSYWGLLLLLGLIMVYMFFPVNLSHKTLIGGKPSKEFRTQDKTYYKAEDFGVKDFEIETDRDADGIKDIEDIVSGAESYILTDPKYDGSYVAGGYPPKGKGVCTDVIWAAFDNAGYDFKKCVDMDISSSRDAYPDAVKPDPNIDFRRVQNLNIFFERHFEKLTVSTENPADWSAGDIVVYKNDKHIALCSYRRNKDGLPWIIHNAGQKNLHEDNLHWGKIKAHYRLKKDALAY